MIDDSAFYACSRVVDVLEERFIIHEDVFKCEQALRHPREAVTAETTRTERSAQEAKKRSRDHRNCLEVSDKANLLCFHLP